MNRELPILFTADMVKASDEGRKTCTRRIIRPQPKLIAGAKRPCYGLPVKGLSQSQLVGCYDVSSKEFIKDYSPYQPGDHLWIKQNFYIKAYSQNGHILWGFREDDSPFLVKLVDCEWEKFRKWKHPYSEKSKLFMFKSLAYKWLEVTNVRAERLQDITYIDILNEGVILTNGKNREINMMNDFWKLWDSINEKRGFPWLSNPYVWVYDFKRIDR